MAVPHTGSEAWTRELGWGVEAEWRPWMLEEQVAGFVTAFKHGLSYATVKVGPSLGAGGGGGWGCCGGLDRWRACPRAQLGAPLRDGGVGPARNTPPPPHSPPVLQGAGHMVPETHPRQSLAMFQVG
jgi:hypothetical protein